MGRFSFSKKIIASDLRRILHTRFAEAAGFKVSGAD